MQTKIKSSLIDLTLKTVNLGHVYSPNTPFEFQALKDVNVDFSPGKFYAIVGKTGSGKSTLVQHLNALLKPTSGKIIINNKIIDSSTKKIKDAKEIRKKVGLVFQFPEYQLFDTTVLKDVMFGPLKLGQSKAEAENSAKSALQSVGLDFSLWEKSPFELSGGQKRRAAIAGILAINTDVIIFDEPTAGLDPQGEKNINSLIVKLKKLGKCIIVVTHNLTHVLEYADQVIIMNKKTIKMNIDKKALFSKPEALNDMELTIPMQTKIIEHLKTKGFKFTKDCTNLEILVKQLKENIK